MKRLLCVLCLVCVMLTGCSAIELTDQEAGMISEYAAYVVLRHNRMYHARLQDEVYETEPETMAPAIMQPEQPADGSGSGSGGTSSGVEDLSTLAQALGLEGFQVNYSGYDIMKSYEDEYFSFSATSKNTLLVLRFEITNTGEQEAEANVLKNQLRFRCTVNHEKRVGSQLTMLVNDLYSFKSVIAPQETQEAILIFQVPEKFDNAVEALELTVKGNDRSHKYNLK